VTATETVRAYATAWAAGDGATAISFYADDIVLHYFGQSPLAGDHAGKPAALAALARVSALTKRALPEIHDVIGSDTHAAILARESWMDGDNPVSINRVLLFHVDDGKLTECWIYDQDQRLVDAIFSRES
jgi:hypothetical protein